MIQQLGCGETATGGGEAKSPTKATLEDSGGSDLNFLHICLFTQAGKNTWSPLSHSQVIKSQSLVVDHTVKLSLGKLSVILPSFTEVDWWIAGGFHILVFYKCQWSCKVSGCHAAGLSILAIPSRFWLVWLETGTPSPKVIFLDAWHLYPCSPMHKLSTCGKLLLGWSQTVAVRLSSDRRRNINDKNAVKDWRIDTEESLMSTEIINIDQKCLFSTILDTEKYKVLIYWMMETFCGVSWFNDIQGYWFH